MLFSETCALKTVSERRSDRGSEGSSWRDGALLPSFPVLWDYFFLSFFLYGCIYACCQFVFLHMLYVLIPFFFVFKSFFLPIYDYLNKLYFRLLLVSLIFEIFVYT